MRSCAHKDSTVRHYCDDTIELNIYPAPKARCCSRAYRQIQYYIAQIQFIVCHLFPLFVLYLIGMTHHICIRIIATIFMSHCLCASDFSADENVDNDDVGKEQNCLQGMETHTNKTHTNQSA